MSTGGYKGEYNAPAHKASTVQGSYMSDDSTGVSDGLSARMDMDSENLHDFKVNNETSVSGNPRQSIKPRGSKSVKEKGHSFDMC
jgi:hypothetical protein